jgi:hypothetical protein
LAHFWGIDAKHPHRKTAFLTANGDGIPIVDFAYLAVQFNAFVGQWRFGFMEPLTDAKDADREYCNPQYTAAFSAFCTAQLTA